MTNNKFKIFPNDKGWIEQLSEQGVFEEKINLWIEDCKKYSELTKEDLLNVTEKVALHRNTPELLEEIKQRIG